jgi:mannose-6-phosphate isomerase-like protein (cupin superfamily)
MRELYNNVLTVELSTDRPKDNVMRELSELALSFGYKIVDTDMSKPWGGFIRFDTSDAGSFVENFFPGLDINEARLGDERMELSPKFLLVEPDKRLSWQRHERRAERWAYLTSGAYHKSLDPNDQGDLKVAQPGDVVQFQSGECHRLVGLPGDKYTLVAEIWQHTDPSNPSEEADIERLADDFNR